jgi:hypothetical protein
MDGPESKGPERLAAPPPFPVDRRVGETKKGTCLQLSGAGEACEDLLHRCIDGDYHQLPTFALKVWQWFGETPKTSNPEVMAQNVGQKAAFLLFSMNKKFEAQKLKGIDNEARGSNLTADPVEIAILFCAGLFAKDAFMWSASAACVISRFMWATGLLSLTKTASPLPEVLVMGHAYIMLAQTPLMSVIHAAVWHFVWSWSVKRLA